MLRIGRNFLGGTQSSGAIVTRRPSSESLNCNWQDRRLVSLRWSELSSRSFSSSLIAGRLSAKAGSTKTWQVAQEQQPPHSASRSSKPLSRKIGRASWRDRGGQYV